MKRIPDRDEGILVEDAIGRLSEALAILVTIEEHNLLGELPADATAREAHQRAVSLLAVLRRELQGVVQELDAAFQTHEAIRRARDEPAAE